MGLASHFQRTNATDSASTTGSHARKDPLVMNMSQRPTFGQWIKVTWIDLVTMAIMGMIGLAVSNTTSHLLSRSNISEGLQGSSGTISLVSDLLPKWRNRLPSIRLPHAKRNRADLGCYSSRLSGPCLHFPHMPDPSSFVLGLEQRHHRTFLLPSHHSYFPSHPQVAYWRTPTTFLDRVQT